MSFGNEISLSEALSKMLKHLNLDDDVKIVSIKKAWYSLFNQAVNQYIRELKFSNGVLFIYVSSPALRQDLFMNRGKLKQRLNEELNHQWIQEIRLK